MKPTCVTVGATFLSSSSDFPNIAYSKKVKPVTLPPGRARLEMKPCPTGSVTSTKTIGIERITCTASERITLPFGQHCIGSNEHFDRAQIWHQNHCRSAQPMSLMGHEPRTKQPD